MVYISCCASQDCHTCCL